MNATKNILIYVFLFFLLSLSGWYFGKTTKPKLTQHALAHQVDAIMTQLHFYEFDEQGQLSKHLIADKMEHIPYKNQFILTQPHFLFHTVDKKSWHLTSHQATTTQGIDKILFQHQVVLMQHQSNDNMSMHTQHLTYLPKRTLAFTDSTVIFKQSTQRLESEGMQANLSTNHIILNHAHATLYPKIAS